MRKFAVLATILLPGCTTAVQPEMLTAPAMQPVCFLICTINTTRTTDSVTGNPQLTTLTTGADALMTTGAATLARTENGGGNN